MITAGTFWFIQPTKYVQYVMTTSHEQLFFIFVNVMTNDE